MTSLNNTGKANTTENWHKRINNWSTKRLNLNVGQNISQIFSDQRH